MNDEKTRIHFSLPAHFLFKLLSLIRLSTVIIKRPPIEEGMRQQLAEIDKIANSPEAPTFENTLVAMEKSGQLLSRVTLAFNGVTGANTDSILQAVEEAVAPKIAAHKDAIYMNEKLFQRVKTLFAKSRSGKT